ncbi:MAG: pyruvate dehydrogenase (acetyl-transferring), homodimeric type [Planctomycetes bacterium]|nr:pyruvate dehydrogenase (acetyl-transferring), homodimeric type [Planctomycetota bacterium]
MHGELDPHIIKDTDPEETREWLDSFDALVEHHGMERAHFLLTTLLRRAQVDRVRLPALVQTPYVNTIPPEKEPPYPGDERIELAIRRHIRWNAMAMVMRANTAWPGIGGHLSTYASAATLYEVGFHHFFRGPDGGTGDQVFFQGHASPGIYARAFLEGRLTEGQLLHFRREVDGRGLSSYPHPYLMSDFWQFPTVSMGLGPITAIYQARFNRYLQARGIRDTEGSRVWCFLGDGECDEPEALGALHLAAREGLGNLCFVVNCNLQRLDGPVRGNGKVIQELEAVFHGAGWRVVKVIWGREWDPLLAQDREGLLVRRMGEVVDGQYQKNAVEDGAYTRQDFFGADPRLLALVGHLSDEDIRRLRRGGHDFRKVYAAYTEACRERDKPVVILAKTVKGWTLGPGAEARNVAHQAKKLGVEELKAFRDRLELDLPDERLAEAPFIRFPEGSAEFRYLVERRRALGGFVPQRRVVSFPLPVPALDWFGRFLEGTAGQEVSTTGAFARLLAQLMSHPQIGRRVVPIIPDEARTFGLDALFRRYGIYSSLGQLYTPVDAEMLLSYREARDGQVLEEGICEAGAMASLAAAGTSYATFGEPMAPFYIFYSMFGFQRTGDQVWQLGDQRVRGFLCGATAGRTTLNGEGLQHQDGHSHLLASTYPHVEAWDPAYAYELAVIVRDGLHRMLKREEDVVYYLTLQNEAYAMPAMPAGAETGVLEGIYLLAPSPAPPQGAAGSRRRAQLLGSGSILNQEVLRAQRILAERHAVDADVWSVTSFGRLRREALGCEEHNLLHPEATPRTPRIVEVLAEAAGPVVAATDSMKAVPDQVARWVPGGLYSLGTDGFGRSDTRAALRRHFRVDAEHIALAVLKRLADRGELGREAVRRAALELGLSAPSAAQVLAGREQPEVAQRA